MCSSWLVLVMKCPYQLRDRAGNWEQELKNGAALRCRIVPPNGQIHSKWPTGHHASQTGVWEVLRAIPCLHPIPGPSGNVPEPHAYWPSTPFLKLTGLFMEIHLALPFSSFSRSLVASSLTSLQAQPGSRQWPTFPRVTLRSPTNPAETGSIHLSDHLK